MATSSRVRLLILQPLVSLRTLTSGSDSLDAQPIHPHQGVRLAERLHRSGFDVHFMNQLPWRLPIPHRFSRLPRFQLLNARAQLGRFDAVLAYAEGGLKFIAGSLWRQRPRMVPVLLTNPRPRVTALGRLLTRATYATTLRRAAAAICCLREVEETCVRMRGSHERVFYAPTTVDADFYDPALADPKDAPSAVRADRPFVLAVGDSSRDDRLLYEAVDGLGAPLVRVTRDPRVTERVRAMAIAGRGDVILEGVPFAQLRWLYAHAAVCVVTSSLDAWQAAGSTAFTEAAACGTVSVVQGGGCLEREFRPMLLANGCEDAVRFVSVDAQAIRDGMAWGLGVSPVRRADLGNRLRQFAKAELPIVRAHDAFASALLRAMS